MSEQRLVVFDIIERMKKLDRTRGKAGDKMTEIKLCPRCFGKPELKTEPFPELRALEYTVECKCGAHSAGYVGLEADLEAIDSWNCGEIFPTKPIEVVTK